MMDRIVVADTETTGLEPDADIIEFGWTEMVRTFDPVNGRPDGWAIAEQTESFLWSTTKHLTPQVRAIHHLTPLELSDHPSFDVESDAFFLRFAGVAAIAFHNASYDEPLIRLHVSADLWPPVLCTRKIAMRLWPQAPSFSNQALRYWLQDEALWPNNFDPSRAQPSHRAGPDSYVTANLLQVQLRFVSLEQAIAWSAAPKHIPVCPVGFDKGKPWPAVSKKSLEWIAFEARDLDRDVKAAAEAELLLRKTGK